ncbi:putative leader peptide [Streptomyces sp. NPDC041068]|uniref:putative leader peptide n=1 Tax=Streptomyces sp. NPDC041068 TaxID=3155130 RepID=UPI0033F4A990
MRRMGVPSSWGSVDTYVNEYAQSAKGTLRVLAISGGAYGVRSPCEQAGQIVDTYTMPRPGSWPMQPLSGPTVTLVERRHVDLVRVASAICRCAA